MVFWFVYGGFLFLCSMWWWYMTAVVMGFDEEKGTKLGFRSAHRCRGLGQRVCLRCVFFWWWEVDRGLAVVIHFRLTWLLHHHRC
ncbi:hypothetical protein Hdeb2414_s0008g00296771 [Helianthus debilis subsp. tardiflorus]